MQWCGGKSKFDMFVLFLLGESAANRLNLGDSSGPDMGLLKHSGLNVQLHSAEARALSSIGSSLASNLADIAGDHEIGDHCIAQICASFPSDVTAAGCSSSQDIQNAIKHNNSLAIQAASTMLSAVTCNLAGFPRTFFSPADDRMLSTLDLLHASALAFGTHSQLGHATDYAGMLPPPSLLGVVEAELCSYVAIVATPHLCGLPEVLEWLPEPVKMPESMAAPGPPYVDGDLA